MMLNRVRNMRLNPAQYEFDLRPTDQPVSGQCGFTMVEMMIVVAVVGILATIAIPAYNKYAIRESRTEMESAMQTMAQKLEAYKMANNDYGASSTTYGTNMLKNPAIYGYTTYPATGTVKYNLVITTSPTTSWEIDATPAGPQTGDGGISLNSQGQKCWTGQTTCTLSATSGWDPGSST